MRYSFEGVINRAGSHSTRWDAHVGQDLIPMTVADMDFAVAPEIIEALQTRLSHPILGYTHPGMLIDGIRGYLQKTYAWTVDAQDIILLPSVVNALNLVAQVAIEPGEHTLIPSPIYQKICGALEYHRRSYSLSPMSLHHDRWTLSQEHFARLLNPQTRWLIFCNPHNPTGTVFRDDELLALANFCMTHNLMVCSDEIHAPLVIDPRERHRPWAMISPELAKNSVTLMSLNKGFNLSGVGLAWCICQNPTIRLRLENAVRRQALQPGIFSYLATQAAIDQGEDWHSQLLDYLWQQQQVIRDWLKIYPQVEWAQSSATYLAWLNLAGLRKNFSMSDWVRAGVIPMLGGGFGEGYDSYIRINYAMSKKQLLKALERIGHLFGNTL